jgi:hypothetical protein
LLLLIVLLEVGAWGSRNIFEVPVVIFPYGFNDSCLTVYFFTLFLFFFFFLTIEFMLLLFLLLKDSTIADNYLRCVLDHCEVDDALVGGLGLWDLCCSQLLLCL